MMVCLGAECRYKQLVFYLEACESGSMFADLNVSHT